MSLVVTKKRYCDICGKELEDCKGFYNIKTWKGMHHNNITVGYEIDICEDCQEVIKELVKKKQKKVD